MVLLLLVWSPRAQAQTVTDPEAIELAAEAVAAGKEGRLDDCIAKDKASLEKEENARTRLHLSICQAKNGKLLDALRNAQEALEVGMCANDRPRCIKDDALTRVARDRVFDLAKKLPKVTFIPPAGVQDLKVTFDDRPVPTSALSRKFSVDPGKHVVRAEGTQNGLPLGYDDTIDVKESELVTVRLTLKSAAKPGVLNINQIKCMTEAQTQEDVQKCLPQNVKQIVTKLGVDSAGYTDSTHVHVFTPSVRAGVSSPTSGWNVGGSFLVDFVTAASPDIVSEASRRYRERRYVGSLTAGYKPSLFGVQANGFVGSEPDYLSLSGGGSVTYDMNDKLTTPRLGFTHSSDTIGRSDTPFQNWSRSFRTEEVEASVTFVLTPTTVLLVGATFAAERGDQSKPYRFVPTFQKEIAERVPPGASSDLVNLFRLQSRPAEQLPVQRDRYAAGFRFMKRLGQTTLRLEERLYNDSWGIKASTTDLRYLLDVSKYLRIWPHGRFHAQTGANFAQLAYTGVVTPAGQVVLPTYRTTDRELSPLITLTGGGGARLALSSPEAETQWAITLTGDGMYSQYFKSLYIRNRFAVYGVLALDVEF